MSTTTHASARRDLTRPVLARLRAGDSPDEAATALGLDPGLVGAVVSQLVRLGLVRVAGPTPSGGACSGCPRPEDAQPDRRLPSACTGCPLAASTSRTPRAPRTLRTTPRPDR